MFDDASATAAARAYLFETAPVVALRLDRSTRVVEANAQARGLLGERAVGRKLRESVMTSSIDLANPLVCAGGAHRLTVATLSGSPETLYFQFFPLSDGTLALGSFDFREQQKLVSELMLLNGELNSMARRLHQANAELCELNEVNNRLTEKLRDSHETLRQQSLASLNLLEDGAVAREHVEKANEALRKSEMQFRSLVEGAPDAIFVNTEGRFRYLNATACRLFGADSPEQLLQQPVLERIHPSSRSVVKARIKKIRERKEMAPPIEVTYLDLHGRTIPVDATALPFTYNGKEGVLVFARDLSERKRAAEALKRSEDRYRSILEAAPDAIVMLNGVGKIILVNTQAERMFGHPRGALLGRDINFLFPERYRDEHLGGREAYIAHFPAQAIGDAVEVTGLRADGAEFPVEVRGSTLLTEEGKLTLGAFRDVTERRETERRSRQLEVMAAESEAANKAKSMFLSTMSHEIRTPMNAILGYSQLMLRDPDLGADAKANLKIINRSGDHLLNIINNVLDMAKIEAGRLQLALTTFNLRSLLRDIEAMFRLRAEAKAVKFEVLFSGEPIAYVVADEGKISQVLINLLGNAVNFTERGRIGLHLQLNLRAENQLWLSAQVEDTGVGMTPEEQDRLFQPFAQGQSGQRVHHGGTGLGLAISHGVAHLMGGDISVRSQAGTGSIFCFEVPVERGADRDFHRQTGPAGRVTGLQAGQGSPAILIADDILNNREWLSRLLTGLGFSVRSVENGEQAVLACEESDPQLILMDMHMPVMDGLEASRRIKSRAGGKETVIIALTADALEEHRRVVLEQDVDDFISKPCSEGELLEKIRKHLGLVYLYEEDTSREALEAAAKTPVEPTLEQWSSLPADLIQRLRRATRDGDKELLDELILLIKAHGAAECATALQELADAYQYDRLLQVLETT